MANIVKNSGSRVQIEKKARLPLPVWLAFLLLVTMSVGGSLARYSSSASGSSTARVAKFEMATTGENKTIPLKAEYDTSNGTYNFTVTNHSEVLIRYSVLISGVPNDVEVTMQIQGETEAHNPTYNEDGSRTFTGRELAMGTEDTCVLTFYAPQSAPAKTAKVTVQVYTEQVD